MKDAHTTPVEDQVAEVLLKASRRDRLTASAGMALGIFGDCIAVVLTSALFFRDTHPEPSTRAVLMGLALAAAVGLHLAIASPRPGIGGPLASPTATAAYLRREMRPATALISRLPAIPLWLLAGGGLGLWWPLWAATAGVAGLLALSLGSELMWRGPACRLEAMKGGR